MHLVPIVMMNSGHTHVKKAVFSLHGIPKQSCMKQLVTRVILVTNIVCVVRTEEHHTERLCMSLLHCRAWLNIYLVSHSW